jgi:hypothetical protein
MDRRQCWAQGSNDPTQNPGNDRSREPPGADSRQFACNAIDEPSGIGDIQGFQTKRKFCRTRIKILDVPFSAFVKTPAPNWVSTMATLDYGSPKTPRDADAFRAFVSLLPTGICVAIIAGSFIFEDGDSRDIGGACLVVILAPLALIGWAVIISEGTRPRGLIALRNAAIWNAIVAIAVPAAIFAIIHFKLFQP